MSTSFNWKNEAETKWDNRADFWNRKSKNMWDNGSRKDIIPFIENHLVKGSRILDVGCGDGYGSYKLHGSGYDVTGVDLSGEMISLAKKQPGNEQISFLQGDVSELPFETGSFDGIMSINVLEWTENPLVAIKELRRVVKKNGLLCVGLLGPTAGPRTNSYPRLYGESSICNTMMPWEFGKLTKENNLEYMDGFGVYKEGVKEHHKDLPLELKQALTFMWVFMLQKVGE
ncbi:SAM-dependent methyltransferase [Virgibacillus profundi]|uniref:SAM-dependent methyltransferase n=1 Tax=Virgibacillus profundi TaxID=2024555 RepID=A0A2A2IHA9_9BACI|nr:class I SAM-dependent methyltransferase [Virgibacillus profundi]PAV30634.1 SAM-dependent methyltransferase [Virgibacillus profundi]PXY54806.1 class I SAM-dependent methyltransferase [Virgibacillus profundi]